MLRVDTHATQTHILFFLWVNATASDPPETIRLRNNHSSLNEPPLNITDALVTKIACGWIVNVVLMRFPCKTPPQTPGKVTWVAPAEPAAAKLRDGRKPKKREMFEDS